jgi:hypothetical protein
MHNILAISRSEHLSGYPHKAVDEIEEIIHRFHGVIPLLHIFEQLK